MINKNIKTEPHTDPVGAADPDMKLLSGEELRAAEAKLLQHTPQSLKVYGYLHGFNKNKPSTLQVVVDTWPDFNVIIVRPDPEEKSGLQFRDKVTFFATDEQILKRMLREEGAVDWSTHFYVAGADISHAPMLREVFSDRGVTNRGFTQVYLLHLPDISHLVTSAVDSEAESKVSSLTLAHVDLVNQTWKFGGDQKGRRNIENLIGNFPSCCITDEQGRPVSWILLYDYCAIGMLYSLPEHRGKGYAKVLISAMAKKLHREGYPVYCYIEEENRVSHRIFSSLGFTEVPAFRAAWYEINF